MHYSSTQYSSPVGLLKIACQNNQIVGLWIENQKYYGGNILKNSIEDYELPIFNFTKKWLDEYFMGHNPNISKLPLAPMGGEFRQQVWNILCQIPYGKTITYGDIAKEIALKNNKQKMSAQAVGGAVGHNPISIIIPCHRVVGYSGSLTGYAGGINVKVKLLELEKVNMSKLFIPKKGNSL